MGVTKIRTTFNVNYCAKLSARPKGFKAKAKAASIKTGKGVAHLAWLLVGLLFLLTVLIGRGINMWIKSFMG